MHSGLAVPDPLAVLVDIADAVQRHAVRLALGVDEQKGEVIARLEADLLEGHDRDAVRHAVVIADGEAAPAELRILADAVQEFVDGDHVRRAKRQRVF